MTSPADPNHVSFFPSQILLYFNSSGGRVSVRNTAKKFLVQEHIYELSDFSIFVEFLAKILKS